MILIMFHFELTLHMATSFSSFSSKVPRILEEDVDACNNSSHPSSYHSSIEVAGDFIGIAERPLTCEVLRIDLSIAVLLNMSGFMLAFAVWRRASAAIAAFRNLAMFQVIDKLKI